MVIYCYRPCGIVTAYTWSVHSYLGFLGVMEEPDLQRHDSLRAQVNLLLQYPLLPVVHVELCPIPSVQKVLLLQSVSLDHLEVIL